MKKSIIAFGVVVCMAVIISSGCNSPEKKVENAREELKDANQDLNKAQADSVADYVFFKKESDERISANEKAIEAIKAKFDTDKKHMKARQQKVLAELEEKNNNLKKKLNEYKRESADKWKEFKTEFNHDMDGLGQAIKDLSVNNTK